MIQMSEAWINKTQYECKITKGIELTDVTVSAPSSIWHAGRFSMSVH